MLVRRQSIDRECELLLGCSASGPSDFCRSNVSEARSLHLWTWVEVLCGAVLDFYRTEVEDSCTTGVNGHICDRR